MQMKRLKMLADLEAKPIPSNDLLLLLHTGYFISYLLACEVDLFEVLGIMVQMWHYINCLAINQS